LGERDCDDDRIWRAAFREGYRRRPRPGELSNYKFWHWVSRNRGFDVAGDWQDWPSKPIPEGAAIPELEPVPEPVIEPEPSEPSGDFTVSASETVNTPAVSSEETTPPAENGTLPTRPPRSDEPRPLKRDPRLLATLDQVAEIDAAVRLVRTRLARAYWPLSALMVEARAVGIGEDAIKAALLATGARTVSGRLALPG
jgi:hypothetical protein